MTSEGPESFAAPANRPNNRPDNRPCFSETAQEQNDWVRSGISAMAKNPSPDRQKRRAS
jgi:hypothetical protein